MKVIPHKLETQSSRLSAMSARRSGVAGITIAGNRVSSHSMKHYSDPIFVPLVNGYEIVVTENTGRGGFTNHRFSRKTDDKLGVVFTDCDLREFVVKDHAGYIAALQMALPRFQAVCPPLAEHARKIISES